MSGPRQDKARAWADLQELCIRAGNVVRISARQEDRPIADAMALDVMNRFNDLMKSGRMDARQVVLIRYLCRDLWKLLSCLIGDAP